MRNLWILHERLAVGTYHQLGKAIKEPTEDPWLGLVTKHVRRRK